MLVSQMFSYLDYITHYYSHKYIQQSVMRIKVTVEPPKRERFGTRPLCSLFRGCLLSEVAHFYHATAPNYSV